MRNRLRRRQDITTAESADTITMGEVSRYRYGSSCRLSRGLSLAVLVAVVNDSACHLANARIAGAARPADPTRWAHWQASATDLWPILADPAYLAYQRRIPAAHEPGRYELSTPGTR